jgi:hypothetical protein
VDDLQVRRAEIHRRYTDRLKAMSQTDPMYRVLWDERARQLRALTEATPTTNDQPGG